jgi:hypothetical protein
MNAIRFEDLQTGTLSARAENLENGDIQDLSIKPKSHCLFFDPFVCGNYKVQLRLDFKDLDNRGNPTLDADVYNLCSGKKSKARKVKEVHHTEANKVDERIYQWELEDKSLKLRITLTWRVSVIETLTVRDYCSAKVIRPGENE